MSRWTVALIAVALVAADEPKKKDEDALKGSWTISKSLQRGTADDRMEGATVKFEEGGKFTLTPKNGEPAMKGTYKLDGAKTPKAIDFTFRNDQGEDVAIKGIYSLDGDTLKVCHGEPGADRPAELKSTEDAATSLVTMKREPK